MKELPNPTQPLSLLELPRGRFIDALMKLMHRSAPRKHFLRA